MPRFICTKCGEEPPIEKDESNENWEVRLCVCPTCKLHTVLETTACSKEKKDAG